MREREGQIKYIVAVANAHAPINAEEVLGEDRVEQLEYHLQEAADQWLRSNMSAEEPYLEAFAEVS